MRLSVLLLTMIFAGCGDSPQPQPDMTPGDGGLQFEDAAPPEPDLAPRICVFDVDHFDGDCLLAP